MSESVLQKIIIERLENYYRVVFDEETTHTTFYGYSAGDVFAAMQDGGMLSFYCHLVRAVCREIGATGAQHKFTIEI